MSLPESEVKSLISWHWIIGVSVLFFFIVMLIWHVTQLQYQSMEAESLVQETTTLVESLNRQLQLNMETIQFLQNTPPIQGIIRATYNDSFDNVDHTSLAQWKARLQVIFKGYMDSARNIVQLRFIGVANNGRELVRVERAGVGSVVLNEEQLQQKGERPYFKAISSIIRGSVYVSSIDLNQEHGQLQYPYLPVYRVGVPIFDLNQHLFGILIINYDAQLLIEELSQAIATQHQLFVVDGDSRVIYSPNNTLVLNLLDKGQDWAGITQIQPIDNLNDRAWLTFSDRGQHLLAAYKSVHISSYAHTNELKVWVGISDKELNALAARNLYLPISVISIMYALLVTVTFDYRKSTVRSRLLNAARAQFAAIIDSTEEAIIGLSLDGEVTSWNASAQRMFGYSDYAIRNRKIGPVLFDRQGVCQWKNALKTIADGKSVDVFRLVALNHKEETFRVEISLSPILLNQQTLEGITALIRDVSSLEAKENEIAAMQRTLEQQVQERTEELEEARNSALVASLAKSRFIANVSHEIRTPLNGVVGMLRLIKQTQDKSSQERYISMAESSANTLSALIDDVLDLSKIEAGKLDIHHETYSLIDLISDLIISSSIKAQEKGNQLYLDIRDLHYDLMQGDSGRTRQVLTNLIGNSLKFTQQGQVKVILASKLTEDDQIKVSGQVQDSGVGIDVSKLETIFESFNQEDDSVTREFGGTGLGLVITRHLLGLFGGSIHADSSKGKGACFSFDFFQGATNETSRYLDALNDIRIVVLCRSEMEGALLKGQCAVLGVDHISLYFSVADFNPETMKPFDILILDEPSAMQRQDLLSQDGVLVISDDIKASGFVSELTVPMLQRPVVPREILFGIHKLKPLAHDYTGMRLPDLSSKKLSLPDAETPEILLVEDNEVNRAVAKGLIEPMGAVMHTAVNGQEAITWLQQASRNIRVILMDCQMPVLDGYDTTRQLRQGIAGEQYQNIPIIAMTASALSGDRDRCLACGMDDYVTKPLNIDRVNEKLIHWLHTQSNSAETVHSVQTAPNVINLPVRDIESWHAQAFLENLGGNNELAGKVLKLFIEKTPERISAIQEAFQNRDISTVESIAHSIKGSAGNIAAKSLQQLCQSLETDARAENIDGIEPLSNTIESVWQQLQADILQYLEQVRQSVSDENG